MIHHYSINAKTTDRKIISVYDLPKDETETTTVNERLIHTTVNTNQNNTTLRKPETITTVNALKVMRELCEKGMQFVKCDGLKAYTQAHYYDDTPESGIEGAIDLCGKQQTVEEPNGSGSDFWACRYGRGYHYNEETGKYEDLGVDYVLLDNDFDVSIAVPAIDLYNANFSAKIVDEKSEADKTDSSKEEKSEDKTALKKAFAYGAAAGVATWLILKKCR